jgi:hypothetical protein
LALQSPGKSVWVLEAADAIGTGTSSRNSEVLHAGIYYPAGSLKAKLCVKGHALLTAYLQERGLPFWLCGKLIVASSPDQLPALKTLQAKALANGVELTWLEAQQALAMEPALSCVAALHSPRTGLVDSHALMLSLQADVENAGGMVVLHTRVQSAHPTSEGWEVLTEDGTCLQTSVPHAQRRPSAAALSATGGGARAAYQVGVLAAIGRMRREAGVLEGNPFPVISGTSAGAINAAFLASNADRFDEALAELVSVWRHFQVEQVYRSDVLGMIRSGARWMSLLSLGSIHMPPPHFMMTLRTRSSLTRLTMP